MNTLRSIDAERCLYVIDHGDYVSCLGFDVVIRTGNAVIDWLNSFAGREAQHFYIPDSWRGESRAYDLYSKIMEAGAEFSRTTGKRCEAHLIPEFKGREGERVEVVDKYGERRRFYVGKSCGWMPCHLEIARRNSRGGGSVTGYPFQSLKFLGVRR